jgi:hypothetical protein
MRVFCSALGILLGLSFLGDLVGCNTVRWRDFQPEDRLFLIAFPGDVENSGAGSFITPEEPVPKTSYAADFGDGRVSASYAQMPVHLVSRFTAEQLIDAAMLGATEARLGQLGWYPISDEVFEIHGYPGRELTLEKDNDDSLIRVRTCYINGYLFMFLAIYRPAGAAIVDRFFESFRLPSDPVQLESGKPNMPLNPAVGLVTVVAARDQAGRKQDSGATTAPVLPRGLSAIR